jgi:hypothetical protein
MINQAPKYIKQRMISLPRQARDKAEKEMRFFPQVRTRMWWWSLQPGTVRKNAFFLDFCVLVQK